MDEEKIILELTRQEANDLKMLCGSLDAYIIRGILQYELKGDYDDLKAYRVHKSNYSVWEKLKALLCE